MKIICIKNKIENITWEITIGKVYESKIDKKNFYQIINERGAIFYYPKELFITMSEYRNHKLEEIGI